MNGTIEDDRLRSSRPFGLEDGTCYLIPGKQSETSYLLFQGLVEGGTPGLCITRRYPEKVRSRYRLDSVPVWWISYAPGDQNYAPTAIGILARVIETFIDENPRGCVILLDGVESIMNSVGFDKALLFVEHVNEYVIARRAVILLTVDPECFKPSEFARLERTLDTLDEAVLREALENPEQYPRTGIQ
jgi:two-component system cell cycle response regulator